LEAAEAHSASKSGVSVRASVASVGAKIWDSAASEERFSEAASACGAAVGSDMAFSLRLGLAEFSWMALCKYLRA
jgi:hypothetical protein